MHQENIFCSGYFFFLISSITLLSLTFLTTGIQVFAPRMLLAVLKGARCTFVFLLGPVWARGNTYQRPGESHCSETFHLRKDLLRSEGWECKVTDAGRAENSLRVGNLESALEQRAQIANPCPPSIMSYPVLSCSLSTSWTGNCTCLKLTP